MVYVKKVILEGFKGYKDRKEFEFNEEKTILVGDNGIGKTTLLQALRLLLKGSRYEYNGINYLGKYVNNDLKEEFQKSGGTKLPKFRLWLVFDIKNEEKNSKFLSYCGQYGDDHRDGAGISFEYSFDDTFNQQYQTMLKEAKSKDENFEIPFNMYKTIHKKFNGEPYYSREDPFHSIFIDNDNFEGNPFNQFARQVYSSLSEDQRIKVETLFRNKTKDLFSDVNVSGASDTPYNLTVDVDSLKFDSILDVQVPDRGSVEELGSGEENIIKTRLSLKTESKLIIIEEPENHLTAANTRKQIDQIKHLSKNSQLIITTHDSHIVTGLDLKNVIWIKTNNGKDKIIEKMSEIDKKSQHFFERRDDLDFLKLLTAKKIILVEGAAEYILMRTFIRLVLGHDDSSIEILSMGGRDYSPFVDLVKNLKVKMAIFTDNDGNRMDDLNDFNDEQEKKGLLIKAFFDPDCIYKTTFEKVEYYENKDVIEENQLISKGASTTKYKRQNPGKEEEENSTQLAFMLNNKSESAIRMIEYYESKQIKVPRYIEQGLKWLKE